jgi:hypothetical protein
VLNLGSPTAAAGRAMLRGIHTPRDEDVYSTTRSKAGDGIGLPRIMTRGSQHSMSSGGLLKRPDDIFSTGAPESVMSEEDEWAEIMRFNMMLHYEEQRLANQKINDRKDLIKKELQN